MLLVCPNSATVHCPKVTVVQSLSLTFYDQFRNRIKLVIAGVHLHFVLSYFILMSGRKYSTLNVGPMG